MITATLESVEVEIDGAARGYELGTAELAFPVTDADAVMSVSDARADAESAVLVFRVSLDRTRDVPVRVDYATEDGTARAGEDYTAVSGTLVIEAGGREAAVEVAVLAAPHLTGERTLVLRLSNAQNARIVDGEAAGVIARESALAQAWLARFGRAASGHTAQAIARRLEAGQRQTQVTVAGRRLDGLVAGLRSGGMPLGDVRLGALPLGGLATGNAGLGSAASEILTRAAEPGIRGLAAERPYSGGADTRSVEAADFRPALPDFGFRLPAMEEALLGSSFYVEGGAAAGRGRRQDLGGLGRRCGDAFRGRRERARAPGRRGDGHGGAGPAVAGAARRGGGLEERRRRARTARARERLRASSRARTRICASGWASARSCGERRAGDGAGSKSLRDRGLRSRRT